MRRSITREDRARIRLVSEAMRRRATESEIVAALVSSGIPKAAASEFYSLVAHGIRAGVTAEVTDGVSAQQYQRGKSPLWDAAFDEGRKQFKGGVRGVWLKRLAWLLIPTLALILWLLLR